MILTLLEYHKGLCVLHPKVYIATSVIDLNIAPGFIGGDMKNSWRTKGAYGCLDCEIFYYATIH